MPQSVRRPINIPQDVWDSWQDYVEENGIESRSALIRTAVTEYIERRNTDYTRRPIVGTVPVGHFKEDA